jgi:ATP P2X receptor
MKNDSFINGSRSIMGLCELEGWCPVENDHDIPMPILDALNFTIFVKNFIEFPRFNVIRKNIQENATYLKRCQFDMKDHKICPIFRVGTLLDIVETNQTEQRLMLKFGGVIRVKIDWNCNLDKSLSYCVPEYSFGRLDALYKEPSFSHGFNFR